MKSPSQEELATMRDARTASLIRRWLAGKKLTDEEKIEVSKGASIPLEILVLGPSDPGAKQAVQRAQNTRKHAKYPKKLPEYAVFYGKDERTIKRLVRRGKEVGKLPPLDEPARMPGWWRQYMDHEVPDWLLGFPPTGGSPDRHANSSDVRSSNGNTRDKGPHDLSNVKALDLEQNVQELRHSVAINKHLWDLALRDPNPNEQVIALRQKSYERSFELLRKSEASLVEFKKATGGLVDPEPIRAEIAQLLESLRLMRETMPDRIVVQLERILPRRFQRVLRMFATFLRPAIAAARTDEENIFRNLELFDSAKAVGKALGCLIEESVS